MGNEANKKFTWVIKNFSLQPECVISEEFVIGGCNWCIAAFPKGTSNFPNYFSLYLMVADYKTLPCGWERHAKYCLTLVNQLSNKLSKRRGGFYKVDVLEVIGELDVLDSEESQEVTQPLERTKLNHDGAVLVSSSVDVYGFQVHPSQAESVRRIFAKHPDMALEFLPKNQHVRTSCINTLLNLIEMLCQSLQDLSIDDLNQGLITLTYLECSGFKVDWLKRKLEQVKKTKNEEQIGETRMKELEEELKVFKQKCSDIEALLEKEKAKVLAATRAPLTLDDVL